MNTADKLAGSEAEVEFDPGLSLEMGKQGRESPASYLTWFVGLKVH